MNWTGRGTLLHLSERLIEIVRLHRKLCIYSSSTLFTRSEFFLQATNCLSQKAITEYIILRKSKCLFPYFRSFEALILIDGRFLVFWFLTLMLKNCENIWPH